MCGAEFEFEAARSCDASRKKLCPPCQKKRKSKQNAEYRKRDFKKPRVINLLKSGDDGCCDADTRVEVTFDNGRIIERTHHRGGGFYATYKR